MENSKVEEFKNFVRVNPFLISYIKKGEKSWQDLFEVYDLYGDDEGVWNKYLEESNIDNSDDTSDKDSRSNSSLSGYVDEFIKMAKNVDVDKVQEGITSLQKTLSLFGDLFVNKDNPTKGYTPRPLYRRFED